MSQRGFTLLEVLVAFTMLALLFGALFEVFAGGLAAVRKGESHSHATLLAQSKLAELTAGSEFASGSRSGYFEADPAHTEGTSYRWTFTLETHAEDELGPMDRGLVMPYVATVDVQWEEAGGEQRVSLSTLVLGTR